MNKPRRRTSFTFPVTTLSGSSLRNISRIATPYSIDAEFRGKFILSCIVAGIFEPFNLAERIIWNRRIASHRLETPPVFIVGFWRSGTTLLHNLLCQDPQAAYTTTFQTVFPHLILTQSWWLKHLINSLLPIKRPYDNVSMDMDFPQEEDFGLMNLQPASIYKFFLFPEVFDEIVDHELFTAELSQAAVAQWKTSYRTMIAKAVINTGGHRYIGKNPCHLGRIDLLREMFPDAKFIFIHRHPYKVVESLYHFIQSVFPGVQLQKVPADFSRENVVHLYRKAMERYFRDRVNIPESNLIELRLSDFLNDIPGNLAIIYEKLQLGDFSAIASQVEKYLVDNPKPEHPTHPPSKETEELVDRYAAEIMTRLQYHQDQHTAGFEPVDVTGEMDYKHLSVIKSTT